ncbi:MAG TPA: histidine kinase dimerization/phospho-acceptor domain-containing protein, partial [Acidimicrobiales bacterium]|nr:histidine kinase dimerization/phospho-acceptor domain-containing protein [Acidimicrobiales bacterium]
MRSTRRRRPIRALSLLVLVVLGGASIGGALLARSVLRDEQSRLLQERAVEASSTVESLFGNVGTSLPTLAATSSPQPEATGTFISAARSYIGLISGIGAAQSSSTGYRVLAAVGVAPVAGSALPADRTALASVALSSDNVVAGMVATPSGRRMSFALAVNGGIVLYEDLAFDPTKPINLGSSGPFNDLDGVLYASSIPDPGMVVVTTTAHLPLPGRVARTTVQVGTQHWLLVVKNRVPLVGSFAANAPWAVLGGGLLAAVFATVLVETLARRRAYALDLVEERTVELRDALDAQARLEQGERRAREAAEAANRAKSEFLSRMSHELRTPLNAILGFGQLLEMDELDTSQQESVDQILKGGRHLLSLINEVLDISRIETGTLALSPEPVSVADAIGEVVTLMAPLARERTVRLTSGPRTPETATHVQADKQRLKQILLNLVSN